MSFQFYTDTKLRCQISCKHTMTLSFEQTEHSNEIYDMIETTTYRHVHVPAILAAKKGFLAHSMALCHSAICCLICSPCICSSCRSSGNTFVTLKGRMYTALKLLAGLLRRIRVDEGIILPLVRLAAETFTVNSLDLLQVSASGRCLSPFSARQILAFWNT